MLFMLLLSHYVAPSFQGDPIMVTNVVPAIEVLAHDKIKVSFEKSFTIDRNEQEIIKITLEDKEYNTIEEFNTKKITNIEKLEVEADMNTCVPQNFIGEITVKDKYEETIAKKYSAAVTYSPDWIKLRKLINSSICRNIDNEISVKTMQLVKNPLLGCITGIEVCKGIEKGIHKNISSTENQIIATSLDITPDPICNKINITSTTSEGELKLGHLINGSVTIKMILKNREVLSKQSDQDETNPENGADTLEEPQFLIFKGAELQNKESCSMTTMEFTAAGTCQCRK